MTISTTQSFVVLQGNGLTTEFPFNFNIPQDSIKVSITNVFGVETVLTDDGFSVTGFGQNNGGIVTIIPAPVADTLITIERDIPYTQPVSIENQQRFFASVIMNALDRIVMQLQQILREILKAPRVKTVDLTGLNLELPSPSAGEVIGWNTQETGFANVDFASLETRVSVLENSMQQALARISALEQNN